MPKRPKISVPGCSCPESGSHQQTYVMKDVRCRSHNCAHNPKGALHNACSRPTPRSPGQSGSSFGTAGTLPGPHPRRSLCRSRPLLRIDIGLRKRAASTWPGSPGQRSSGTPWSTPGVPGRPGAGRVLGNAAAQKPSPGGRATLRLFMAQRGRCPLCRGLLLHDDQQPHELPSGSSGSRSSATPSAPDDPRGRPAACGPTAPSETLRCASTRLADGTRTAPLSRPPWPRQAPAPTYSCDTAPAHPRALAVAPAAPGRTISTSTGLPLHRSIRPGPHCASSSRLQPSKPRWLPDSRANVGRDPDSLSSRRPSTPASTTRRVRSRPQRGHALADDAEKFSSQTSWSSGRRDCPIRSVAVAKSYTGVRPAFSRCGTHLGGYRRPSGSDDGACVHGIGCRIPVQRALHHQAVSRQAALAGQSWLPQRSAALSPQLQGDGACRGR
jgi:hypothetical protein